jgi:tetratricopeptide (TPR) repeat protein
VSELALLNIDEAVEGLVSQLQGGRVFGGRSRRGEKLFRVAGEPTAGKTAVLEGVRQKLETSSRLRPVMVNPPLNAHDAGPVALLQIAEAVVRDRSRLEPILDPRRSWDEKFGQIRRWLSREANNVVLLLDEPAEWPSYDTYFGELARQVWQLAFDGIGCRTVVAGRIPTGFRKVEPLTIRAASDPEQVLERVTADSLQPSRRAVREVAGKQLESLSPLQVRLLVALIALDPDEAALLDFGSTGRAQLASRLQTVIERMGESGLGRVWREVAQVREAFDRDLLTHLGIDGLATTERAILEQCLLFRRDDGLILHETLRTFAPTAGEQEMRGTHERLGDYYRQRFVRKGEAATGRLRDSIEAFYHASRAGVVGLDKYRPFFTDQLNILGYNLSVEHHAYSEAASVFGHALQWDAENAYAAHYRAFNLDQVHERPVEVEQLYRRAVELNPDHTWYHSRLITFLIAWSRIEEARAAWLDALETLERPGADLPDAFYFGLHLHVARVLIYRGELDFAEAVLKHVPPTARRNPRFGHLEARLIALIEARDHGSFVPLPYLRPKWWSEPPRRLPSTCNGKRLSRWLAAEVDSAGNECVELHVADVVVGEQTRPDSGNTRVARSDLRGWWDSIGSPDDLAPGDFLEIGFYGDEPDVETIVVKVPTETDWDEGAFDLHPDRYLEPLVA